MSRRYPIAEARANLPTLIDEVESGAAVELTRRGKSVAVLVSVTEYARLRGERTSFKDAYQQFLKRHPLTEAGLESGFADKLRDRSTGVARASVRVRSPTAR
jgi:prevent-host-death family protein